MMKLYSEPRWSQKRSSIKRTPTSSFPEQSYLFTIYHWDIKLPLFIFISYFLVMVKTGTVPLPIVGTHLSENNANVKIMQTAVPIIVTVNIKQ